MNKEIKVILISDSHSRHENIYVMKKEENISSVKDLYKIHGMNFDIFNSVFLPSDADMIIHGGDMSIHGSELEVDSFLKWYSNLPYKYKILIAGNHDYLFEKFRGIAQELLKKYPNIIYLESSEVIIEGIKIYGEPRQPWFHNWAFNVERGEVIRRYWDVIPDDTDILVTHGPPYDILDLTASGQSVGCVDLRERIKELKKLKLCIFGHIHEDAGYKMIDGVHFVNASVLNLRYQLHNKPQAFRIDKNKNITKIDLMENITEEKQETINGKPFIDIEELSSISSKLSIQIGKIISAELIPKSNGLKLTVKFGENPEDIKTSFTNLGKSFKPEEFIGLICPFIMNLKPSVIKGVESQVMIMPGEIEFKGSEGNIEKTVTLDSFLVGAKLI